MRRALDWTPPLPASLLTTTPRRLLEPSSTFPLPLLRPSPPPPPPISPPPPPPPAAAELPAADMDDACAVCAEPLEWVAYGACAHREVCSTCVARLRFVLRDLRCCLCITPCPAVFVTKAMGDRTKVIPDFSALRGAGGEGKAGEYWHHEATQTWFDDADQYRMISAMCRLSCSVCDSNKKEEEERTGKAAKAKRKSKIRSVDQLKGHLLDRHGLYMCDLCLEGRKVFICEQKLYTMSQLNQHIKSGDSEVDGSEVERRGFGGHPMQHSGQYDYFRNYDDLEMHFQRDHFLCEDKGCLEKKFVRHNGVEHGKHMPGAVDSSSSSMQNGIAAVGHGLGGQSDSSRVPLQSLSISSSSGQSSETRQSFARNRLLQQACVPPLSRQEVHDARVGSVLQEASFPSLPAQSRKAPAHSQSSRTAARIGDQQFRPLSVTSNRNVALAQQGTRTLPENTHVSGLAQYSKRTENMHQAVQPQFLKNNSLIPSGSTSRPVHVPSSAGNERQDTFSNSQVLSSVEDILAANKALVEKMRAALGMDQDMFNAFKEIAGEYRQGVINSSEYLSYVKQFGLLHLVPEMARLLPDAQKQKELADAYYANLRLTSLQENGGGGTDNSKQGNQNKKGKGGVPDAIGTSNAATDPLKDKLLNTAIKFQSNYMPQEGCCGVQRKEGRTTDGSSQGLPLKGAWQSRGGQRLFMSKAKK
uniref:RING-type domain-containing protein n=1 Tax=Oryza glumipatula TaxID=40148 RepID=A0A0D9Y644_9ORYZ